MNFTVEEKVRNLRKRLDDLEAKRLSEFACKSADAVRISPDPTVKNGHRQEFSVDADRIMHSMAYTRYIDKTQVFSLIKADHITHRVLHVQLVSKIARTIGRLLCLNEDLIEAISLGHDLGHTPFGHDGEAILSEICQKHKVGFFLHNIQSIRFLQDIERKGRGWNLSLQTLDGILCHDGEIHKIILMPSIKKDFIDFSHDIKEKRKNIQYPLTPMTMEGCVVRMADTISYIGRDIDDAIRLGVIKREDIPKECTEILGDTNGKIVYSLVEDLIANSINNGYIAFSQTVGDALGRLKEFNTKYIYRNNTIKKEASKIKLMFNLLFEKYMKDIEKGDEKSEIFSLFLSEMAEPYIKNSSNAEIVRDFIAGMTDDYFLNRCNLHFMPQQRDMRGKKGLSF